MTAEGTAERTVPAVGTHIYIDTELSSRKIQRSWEEQALWILIHTKHGQQEKRLCFYPKDQNTLSFVRLGKDTQKGFI